MRPRLLFVLFLAHVCVAAGTAVATDAPRDVRGQRMVPLKKAYPLALRIRQQIDRKINVPPHQATEFESAPPAPDALAAVAVAQSSPTSTCSTPPYLSARLLL